MVILWFGLASAAGAITRYIADVLLPQRGILLVNIFGSLLAGLLSAVVLINAWAPVEVLFIWVVGFAGSLTTFSTVALQTAQDLSAHGWRQATATWGMHLSFSMAATVSGFLPIILLAG